MTAERSPVTDGLQPLMIEESPDIYFYPPYVGVGWWVGILLDQIADDALESHLREARRTSARRFFDSPRPDAHRTPSPSPVSVSRAAAFSPIRRATLVFPIGNRHAIKVGWSTGAFIRSGADFTTFSVGWQAGWLTRKPPRT